MSHGTSTPPQNRIHKYIWLYPPACSSWRCLILICVLHFGMQIIIYQSLPFSMRFPQPNTTRLHYSFRNSQTIPRRSLLPIVKISLYPYSNILTTPLGLLKLVVLGCPCHSSLVFSFLRSNILTFPPLSPTSKVSSWKTDSLKCVTASERNP